jgi:hypothetical protein
LFFLFPPPNMSKRGECYFSHLIVFHLILAISKSTPTPQNIFHKP